MAHQAPGPLGEGPPPVFVMSVARNEHSAGLLLGTLKEDVKLLNLPVLLLELFLKYLY